MFNLGAAADVSVSWVHCGAASACFMCQVSIIWSPGNQLFGGLPCMVEINHQHNRVLFMESHGAGSWKRKSGQER